MLQRIRKFEIVAKTQFLQKYRIKKLLKNKISSFHLFKSCRLWNIKQMTLTFSTVIVVYINTMKTIFIFYF